VIVDTHTHVWDFEKHIHKSAADQLRRIMPKPERLIVGKADFARNTSKTDRVFLLGLRARYSGIQVPNEFVADFVAGEPDRFVGFMGIDPQDPDYIEQVEIGRSGLGLKGIVLAPDLGGFDPRDARLKEVYARAMKHRLPIFVHAGHFPIARAALQYSNPALLDDVLRTYKDLKIVICHFGRPYIQDTVALLYKHPGAFADVAGIAGSPWELYNALMLASEYNVLSRVFFSSDYPFTLSRDILVNLREAGGITSSTGLPTLRESVLDQIVHRNPFGPLGLSLSVLSK